MEIMDKYKIRPLMNSAGSKLKNGLRRALSGFFPAFVVEGMSVGLGLVSACGFEVASALGLVVVAPALGLVVVEPALGLVVSEAANCTKQAATTAVTK